LFLGRLIDLTTEQTIAITGYQGVGEVNSGAGSVYSSDDDASQAFTGDGFTLRQSGAFASQSVGMGW
jgi:hypothetical protein